MTAKNQENVKWLAIFNITGFAGTIVMNFLANSIPLNNKNTGELSDQYPNLFVPAGFTFAIWGIIYLLLALFIYYQAVSAFKSSQNNSEFISKIGWFFFVSCLANMGWIVVWHYEYVWLSLLVMLIILGSLITIYLKLRIGVSKVSRGEKFLVQLPFSVYLGWITVATIANVTALLVHTGWDRFGLSEQFWTVVMILTSAAVGVLMLVRRNDLFFSLVLLWAYFGIYSKRLDNPGEPSQAVMMAVLAGVVVVVVGMGYVGGKKMVKW